MVFEQIAYATEDPEKLMRNFVLLGADTWTKDTVVAKGTVFGKEVENTAELYFNYQLGFELEILRYIDGPNWHEQRNPEGAETFKSHMGLHVTKEKMDEIKSNMKQVGVEIAQEVWTQSHTNAHIKGKRKYHYVVFDSIETFGFDLKLIERIML